jgi:hypothetical protein
VIGGAIADMWSERYNETRIHDTLRERGHTTWLSPEPVVRIDRGPMAAGHALRETFAWSRLYAGRRTHESGIGTRLMLALTAPLLVPLLLFKQSRIAHSREADSGRSCGACRSSCSSMSREPPANGSTT